MTVNYLSPKPNESAMQKIYQKMQIPFLPYEDPQLLKLSCPLSN